MIRIEHQRLFDRLARLVERARIGVLPRLEQVHLDLRGAFSFQRESMRAAGETLRPRGAGPRPRRRSGARAGPGSAMRPGSDRRRPVSGEAAQAGRRRRRHRNGFRPDVPLPLEALPHDGQLVLHDREVGIAVGRLLLESARQDRHKPGIDLRQHLGERLRLLVQDLVHRLVDLPGEGLDTRQHLVQHGADGEDVALRSDVARANLLGRHVVGRADDGLRLRELRGLAPREPEVENLERPLVVEHQVRGLDVAMHDALAMRVGQAGAELLDPLQALRDREGRLAAHDLAERLAVHVLHRDVGQAAEVVDVEDGDDVGMAQRAGRLRFAREPLARFR